MTASLLSTAFYNHVYYYGSSISKYATIPAFQAGILIPTSIIPTITLAESSNLSVVQDILQLSKSFINKGGKNKVSKANYIYSGVPGGTRIQKLLQLTKTTKNKK